MTSVHRHRSAEDPPATESRSEQAPQAAPADQRRSGWNQRHRARLLTSLLVALFLVGCASGYELRPDSLTLRSRLDETKALEIVREAFVASGFTKVRVEGRRLLY